MSFDQPASSPRPSTTQRRTLGELLTRRLKGTCQAAARLRPKGRRTLLTGLATVSLVASGGLVGLGAGPAAAAGATYYVTSSGTGTCADNSSSNGLASIAGALACAVSGDTISLGAGNFAGGFTVSANVTISGAGASSVIEGPASSEVTLGTGTTLALEDLTIDASGTSEGISGTTGSLSLVDVTVANANDYDVSVLPGSGTADVSIFDSAILSALFGVGDGLRVSGSGPDSTLSVVNSTVSNNTQGIVAIATNSDLRDDTIANNGAGGVDVLSGTTTLADTIDATNGLLHGDCLIGGPLDDGGHNLIGNADGNQCTALSGVDGNLVGTATSPIDPKLGALADNGGPTETQALLPGSPAVNAGSPSDCQAAPVNDLDQRGDTRNAATRGSCDIGAYDTGGRATTTWYVSSSATSDPTCAAASKTNPFASIAGALACAVSGDTISLGAGNFAGGFTVSANVTISGAGASSVIEGPASSEVTLGTGTTLALEDLTIDASGTSEGISGTTGSLSLVDVTVANANDYDVSVLPGSGTADVSIFDSAILSALFGVGDGLRVSGSGPDSTLSVVNSTVSNNTGQGIVAIATNSDLRDDTIANNGAGGVDVLSGTTTLADTIDATNGLLHGDCLIGGPLDDGGHNLIGNADGNQCTALSGVDGNLVGTATSPIDPKLGALADNGGPTETQALLPGSPAVNAGSPSDCQAAPVNDLDQRGDTRNAATRGSCDIGAYDTGGRATTTITSLTPASGQGKGGTKVKIAGTGFNGTASVLFGTTPAVSFKVNGKGTSITAVSPAERAGTVSIFVSAGGGTNSSSPSDQFTFTGPVVNVISTSGGSAAGGTKVHITGTGLGGATSVMFGTVPAATFTSNNKGTKATAVAPAEAAGTVDITVTTPGGTSTASSSDEFTYIAAAITSVSPDTGPAAGGTKVDITGTELSGATSVLFGSIPATSFTVNRHGSKVIAIAPQGASGTVAITVVTPAGTTADQYQYR